MADEYRLVIKYSSGGTDVNVKWQTNNTVEVVTLPTMLKDPEAMMTIWKQLVNYCRINGIETIKCDKL